MQEHVKHIRSAASWAACDGFNASIRKLLSKFYAGRTGLMRGWHGRGMTMPTSYLQDRLCS